MPTGVRVGESQRQAITADMNLRKLKRLDPAVVHVMCSSSQVAVYELPVASQGEGEPQWARRDIEGSLYIVARTPGPGEAAHRLVVLNRKSPENFIDDIIPASMDLETADQMIMFQSPDSGVSGLWFYVPEEMRRVFEFMRAIVDETPLPNQPDAAVVLPKTPGELSPESLPNAGKDRTSGKPKRKGKSTQPRRSPSPPGTTDTPAPSTASAHKPDGGSVNESLAKFFPNMKLTNGVAGSSPPSNATRAETDGSPPRQASFPTEALSVPEAPAALSGVADPSDVDKPVEKSEDTGKTDRDGPAATSVHAPTGFPGMIPALGMMPYPHFPPRHHPQPGMHGNGMHGVSPQHHHMMMMMQSLQSLQSRDQQLTAQLQHVHLQPSTVHSSAQAQQMQHEAMHVRQSMSQLQTRMLQHQHAMSQTVASVSSGATGVFSGGMTLQGVPAPPMPAPVQPQLHGGAPPAAPIVNMNGCANSREMIDKNGGRIGQAIGQAPLGIQGGTNNRLDRTQFRALLQKMLTDKKLFNKAYTAYENAAP